MTERQIAIQEGDCMSQIQLDQVGVMTSPLAGSIGAEISGVDLASTLSDAKVARVRQALLRYKVIFIRDQQLDYAAQVAFAQRLGELTPGHPIFAAPAKQQYMRALDSKQGARANHWHADLTFTERPPAIAVLHGVVKIGRAHV